MSSAAGVETLKMRKGTHILQVPMRISRSERTPCAENLCRSRKTTGSMLKIERGDSVKGKKCKSKSRFYTTWQIAGSAAYFKRYKGQESSKRSASVSTNGGYEHFKALHIP